MFTFPEETCSITTANLNALIYCGDTFELLAVIPLGQLIVFPDLNFVNVDVIEAPICGEQPLLVSSGCGTPVITNVVPPVNDPINPIDGYIEYALDFGFDISSAPDGCFDESQFAGTAPIAACTDGVVECDASNGTLSIRKVGE